MRSPRYSPPQTRQNVAGRVLALPSDSHELFRRDLRQSLARAAAAHAIPSAYHVERAVAVGPSGMRYTGTWIDA